MAVLNDYKEIQTIDNFLSKEDCQAAIQHIDRLIEGGFALEVNANPDREDECIHFTSAHVTNASGMLIWHSFMHKFYNEALQDYMSRFPILKIKRLGILEGKAQRTKAGGGFHNWHYESFDNTTSERILAWTVYLNDDFEGGETEFLNQNMRVQPVAGRFSMFPTSFLHTHRGNPPISGTKYILTGWVVDLDPYASMMSS